MSNPLNNYNPWNDSNIKPLVQFKNVSKVFDEDVAIENLCLDIYPKEFFALLGPSGCGKTTLMRLLSGFEELTSGKILLDGNDISEIPPHKRPINMMFQSFALFPHLNVYNNIAFGLKRMGWNRADIERRVDEMVELTYLQRFVRRKPNQLSGGQKQRVALARALAQRPKLLLLDEPLGALDKKLREKTQFELVNIQEQLELTFIIVTHDQEEAMTVASRIAVMDEGKLMQVGIPSDIYEHPNSVYVADFLGDINLFNGRLYQKIDNIYTLKTRDELTLYVEHNESLNLDDKSWVAIRPEKVNIQKSMPNQDNINIIKGRIEDIAYTGNLTNYHVKISNGQIIKVEETNRQRLSNRELTWEDDVYIFWDYASANLLSK